VGKDSKQEGGTYQGEKEMDPLNHGCVERKKKNRANILKEEGQKGFRKKKVKRILKYTEKERRKKKKTGTGRRP